MHLRPELVLLQKTMVSVEGVARRLYPEHNLWEAARPVVKAWIARELSPIADAKRLIMALIKKVRMDEDAESLEPDLAETKPDPRIGRAQWMAFWALLTALFCLLAHSLCYPQLLILSSLSQDLVLWYR